MDIKKKSMAAGLMLFLFALVFLTPGSGTVHVSSPPDGQAPASWRDLAQDIGIDAQDNCFVTGYSFGGSTDYDFFTLKYSSRGELLWRARYNGTAGQADFAQCLTVCGDNGVVVAGHSSGRDSSLDATVVKYDGRGQLLWSDRYDGPAGRDDYIYASAEGQQGHIHVGGYSMGSGTEQDYLLIKYTQDGRRMWTARYNPPRNRDDILRAIALDPLGNVLVTGVDRVRETSYDAATLKYSPDGRRVWLARYSGPGEAFDSGRALAVDFDGHVIMTGTGSFGGEALYDIVTVKYSKDGRVLWTARYNGVSSLMDKPCAVAVAESGRIFVAGVSQGAGTGADIVLLGYSPAGDFLWEMRYDGPAHGADMPHDMILDQKGNIVLAGFSRVERRGRDAVVIKCRETGDMLWAVRYNGAGNLSDEAKSAAVDSKGDILVTGFSHGGESCVDAITLKYDSKGRLLWEARYTGQQDRSR
jgi:uncharacterized delta-60 repeat protein